MELLTIFSQPITQVGVLVIALVGLKKAGVDVPALFRALFGSANTVKEVDADNRNVAQTMLSQMQLLFAEMQTLSGHFNHETTDELVGIRTALEKLGDKQEVANNILRNMDRYGVKTLKE